VGAPDTGREFDGPVGDPGPHVVAPAVAHRCGFGRVDTPCSARLDRQRPVDSGRDPCSSVPRDEGLGPVPSVPPTSRALVCRPGPNGSPPMLRSAILTVDGNPDPETRVYRLPITPDGLSAVDGGVQHRREGGRTGVRATAPRTSDPSRSVSVPIVVTRSGCRTDVASAVSVRPARTSTRGRWQVTERSGAAIGGHTTPSSGPRRSRPTHPRTRDRPCCSAVRFSRTLPERVEPPSAVAVRSPRSYHRRHPHLQSELGRGGRRFHGVGPRAQVRALNTIPSPVL
jgi:hypothetical protein